VADQAPPPAYGYINTVGGTGAQPRGPAKPSSGLPSELRACNRRQQQPGIELAARLLADSAQLRESGGIKRVGFGYINTQANTNPGPRAGTLVWRFTF
jgi:hypothetical protein